MGCNSIPEIGFREFTERFFLGKIRKRIPKRGTIELTNRCNLNCKHCYITHQGYDELDTHEWKHLLDQIADEACLGVVLTGGEPLFRKDFAELYIYAKLKGLLITLFTNGTLIDKMIEVFKEYPPHSCEVSIYGTTEATYESVTGVRGSFRQCVQGIELLLKQGISVSLKTMVMRDNAHELNQMRDMATRLGVKFGYDSLINPRLNGSSEPCRLRLSPREIVELDLQYPGKAAQLKDLTARAWTAPKNQDLYTCGAGIRRFHISSDGRLYICIMARDDGYDLRHGSFNEGFFKHFPKVRSQQITRMTKCRTCKMISLCGQCPGWAYLENHDKEEPVEFLCQVAHLRAEVLNIGKEVR